MSKVLFLDGTSIDIETLGYSDIGIVEAIEIETVGISIVEAVSIFSDTTKTAKIVHMENDAQVEEYEGFTKLVGLNVMFKTENVKVRLHKV